MGRCGGRAPALHARSGRCILVFQPALERTRTPLSLLYSEPVHPRGALNTRHTTVLPPRGWRVQHVGSAPTGGTSAARAKMRASVSARWASAARAATRPPPRAVWSPSSPPRAGGARLRRRCSRRSLSSLLGCAAGAPPPCRPAGRSATHRCSRRATRGPCLRAWLGGADSSPSSTLSRMPHRSRLSTSAAARSRSRRCSRR